MFITLSGTLVSILSTLALIASNLLWFSFSDLSAFTSISQIRSLALIVFSKLEIEPSSDVFFGFFSFLSFFTRFISFIQRWLLYFSFTCSNLEVLSLTDILGGVSSGVFLFLPFPGDVFFDGGVFFGDVCFPELVLVRDTLLPLTLAVILSSCFTRGTAGDFATSGI